MLAVFESAVGVRLSRLSAALAKDREDDAGLDLDDGTAFCYSNPDRIVQRDDVL